MISIVVPVFNEEATVVSVIDRLRTIELPEPREIVVVNDGSRDRTRAALDGVGARHPGVTVIHLPENRGKGHAVRVGLARTTGRVVAIQDADLELDPAQIRELVAPILAGDADVVYGSRFLGGSGEASGTCYKVMRGDIARSLPLVSERFEIEPEITARLLLAGHRIVERPVRFSPRTRGAGKKLRWRDGWLAVRVLVGLRVRG
jgi:glycosyltransferase involved in cell wall biosynthesis